jgi:hypothetical protein
MGCPKAPGQCETFETEATLTALMRQIDGHMALNQPVCDSGLLYLAAASGPQRIQ